MNGSNPHTGQRRSRTSSYEIVFRVTDASGSFRAESPTAGIVAEGPSLERLRGAICDAVTGHYDLHRRPKMARLEGAREEAIVLL